VAFLFPGFCSRRKSCHGRIRLRRFFVRRGLKIYPPFIAFILVTVAVRFVLRREFDWRAILSELFFVQNYLGGLWGHTWSLGVEEHFYLLLPPVLILLLRGKTSTLSARLPLVFLAIASACLWFRFQNDPSTPFAFQRQGTPTHLRIDSLLFGVLLSSFYFYDPEPIRAFSRRCRWPLILAGSALLSLPFKYPLEQTPWMWREGYSLLYIGAGMLLIGVTALRLPSTRFVRALAYIGAHSYSIYLWHSAAETWVPQFAERILKGHWNWYFYCGIYLGLSLPLGIAMSKLIEFPVLKLRDRFFPSRSTQDPERQNDTTSAVTTEKRLAILN
jgi:peptidoglycan/LPS O-acetylase OafA/YrhL